MCYTAAGAKATAHHYCISLRLRLDSSEFAAAAAAAVIVAYTTITAMLDIVAARVVLWELHNLY